MHRKVEFQRQTERERERERERDTEREQRASAGGCTDVKGEGRHDARFKNEQTENMTGKQKRHRFAHVRQVCACVTCHLDGCVGGGEATCKYMNCGSVV
jgi:hypothetical protein